MERLAGRGEEAGHRPAALPGHAPGWPPCRPRRCPGRSSRSTLIADEAGVHQLRGRRVLERLVRHHVAPVAGRVPDREQHRHVPPGRPRRTPRPTTPTSRPGCRRAGAGTGWSRGEPVGHARHPVRPGRCRRRRRRWLQPAAPTSALLRGLAAVSLGRRCLGRVEAGRQPPDALGHRPDQEHRAPPRAAGSRPARSARPCRTPGPCRAAAPAPARPAPAAHGAPRSAAPRSTSTVATAAHRLPPDPDTTVPAGQTPGCTATCSWMPANRSSSGSGGVDQRAHQLVVLGRPDLALDVRAAPRTSGWSGRSGWRAP